MIYRFLGIYFIFLWCWYSYFHFKEKAIKHLISDFIYLLDNYVFLTIKIIYPPPYLHILMWFLFLIAVLVSIKKNN